MSADYRVKEAVNSFLDRYEVVSVPIKSSDSLVADTSQCFYRKIDNKSTPLTPLGEEIIGRHLELGTPRKTCTESIFSLATHSKEVVREDCPMRIGTNLYYDFSTMTFLDEPPDYFFDTIGGDMNIKDVEAFKGKISVYKHSLEQQFGIKDWHLEELNKMPIKFFRDLAQDDLITYNKLLFMRSQIFANDKVAGWHIYVGEGGSGKSVMLDYLAKLIGNEDFISRVSLKEFSDDKRVIDIYGKMLNIFDDETQLRIEDLGKAKSIASHADIAARGAYRRDSRVISTKRLVSVHAMNQIPNIANLSSGEIRRLLIIRFNGAWEKSGESKDAFERRVFTPELMEESLAEALAMCQLCHEHHSLVTRILQTYDDEKQSFAERSNPAIGYVNQLMIFADAVISMRNLFNDYSRWCDDMGYDSPNKRDLSDAMAQWKRTCLSENANNLGIRIACYISPKGMRNKGKKVLLPKRVGEIGLRTRADAQSAIYLANEDLLKGYHLADVKIRLLMSPDGVYIPLSTSDTSSVLPDGDESSTEQDAGSQKQESLNLSTIGASSATDSK